VLILIIALVIFGAGKLPQIGDALGKSIKNFKRSADGRDELDVTPRKELQGEHQEAQLSEPAARDKARSDKA
jgi:sec-independent protein translocase protein TatA